jgi:hypothetical protein
MVIIQITITSVSKFIFSNFLIIFFFFFALYKLFPKKTGQMSTSEEVPYYCGMEENWKILSMEIGDDHQQIHYQVSDHGRVRYTDSHILFLVIRIAMVIFTLYGRTHPGIFIY